MKILIPKVNGSACLKIDVNPWGHDIPETMVKLSHDGKSLKVNFICYEWPITIKSSEYNQDVYKDSCVEMFINPFPDDDDRYLNFELNAMGVLLLGMGNDRYDRKRFPELDISVLNITSDAGSKAAAPWNVSLCIPFVFFEELYDLKGLADGSRMMGNFYKCGDETLNPHYGCWNKIETPEADFHRSEFFGEMILG